MPVGIRIKERSPLRGLRYWLDRGVYKQATPNGVSAAQPSLWYQFALNIGSAGVSKDKRLQPTGNVNLRQSYVA
jgi:hypothetical protein